MNRKILVVAAHPDDEVLGCGGTVARLIREGHESCALILGEGITARDNQRDRRKRNRQISQLKDQIERANKIIGSKDTFVYDFPDNRFDTVPLLDLVKIIEIIKEKVKPGIIFTHYEKDLNIDHRITYQAVITAARPLPNESVKEIYSFEVLSSTEWGFPATFAPDVFFDISDTIDIKTEAVSAYEMELREFPHPRSVHAVRLNAEYWAMRVGTKYAEAFKAVRIVK